MSVGKLSSETKISGLNAKTITDFWSWAYSDVLNNVNRSVFAEWLVATALGLTDKPRVEWDAVDLRFQCKGIE